MLSTTYISNTLINNTFINDDDFNDYNYIHGRPLTENELTNINFLINYDFKNSNDNELYNIINIGTHKFFNVHEDIKFNKLKYEIIKKGKNDYYKFENDEELYINNYSTYINLKKLLFNYFQHLLILLNNNIDDDIKDYLNITFFSNINRCKYYKCLKWFCCLFIYWVKLINKSEFNFNKINYKEFRKYILNLRKNKTNYEMMQDILKDFINIDYKFKYYEDLKAFLDFSLYLIYDGNYILN